MAEMPPVAGLPRDWNVRSPAASASPSTVVIAPLGASSLSMSSLPGALNTTKSAVTTSSATGACAVASADVHACVATGGASGKAKSSPGSARTVSQTATTTGASTTTTATPSPRSLSPAPPSSAPPEPSETPSTPTTRVPVTSSNSTRSLDRSSSKSSSVRAHAPPPMPPDIDDDDDAAVVDDAPQSAGSLVRVVEAGGKTNSMDADKVRDVWGC
jgi:hypothetical protein